MLTVRLLDTTDAAAPREAIEQAAAAALDGLHVGKEAIGTEFQAGQHRLRLERVDREGIVDGRWRIEVIPEPGGGERDGEPIPCPRALEEEVGEFLRECRIASPARADRVAHADYEGLVGIPKQDVLARVTASLRDPQWLHEWSSKTFGRAVRGIRLVIERPPLILLHGEPGTGKSALAHVLPDLAALDLKEEVLFVELNERIRGRGIHGLAGANLLQVTDSIARAAARVGTPAIVFLDEAEALASTRAGTDLGSGAQENVALVDALIVSIDRSRRKTDARLVFILATNLLPRIDAAILRRAEAFAFQRPDRAARRELLTRWLDGFGLTASDVEDIEGGLDRHEPAPTASDVLFGVIAPAITRAAVARRRVTSDELTLLAIQLAPTPSFPSER